MQRILKVFGVCLLIVLFISLYSLSAMAQAPEGRKYKLNGSMNLDWMGVDPDGDFNIDYTKYEISVFLGYFLNDMFELGPELSYLQIEGEEEEGSWSASETRTMWSIGVKANAHFNLNSPKVMPYVGVRLALASLEFEEEETGEDSWSEDDTSFIYGVQLGMDYFITSSVSVNPEISYSMGTFDIEGTDVDWDDLSFKIGISAHF